MTKQEVKKLALRGLLLLVVGSAIGLLNEGNALAFIGSIMGIIGIIMLIVAGLNHTLD